MLMVKFKNLPKSDFAMRAVEEKIHDLSDKFRDLEQHDITVTLGMENSPRQAGPDLFTVRVMIRGAKFPDVTLQKSSPNLYIALAEVFEHMLERLNRFGDKKRIRDLKQQRELSLLRKNFWSIPSKRQA